MAARSAVITFENTQSLIDKHGSLLVYLALQLVRRQVDSLFGNFA
jgi:hypothetical protein